MKELNRTADGRIASKKEAQRTDCIDMVTRYKAEAKAALQRGERNVAKALVDKCVALRAAFFADYGEAA